MFENSEKKIEVALKHGAKSLKILPKSFWEGLVKLAGARILSSVSSPLCDSYLLSESSLFVFPQKFLMISAGRTRLIPVVREFLNHVKLDDLDCLFYERKNDPTPTGHAHPFYEDADDLARMMPGAALRFGADSGQNFYVFHLDQRSEHLSSSDATLEVLLHDISPEIRQLFAQEKSKARKWISDSPGFRDFFDAFDIQDFGFQPYGYCLNAVKGDQYFTFHVNPEDRGTYASFETNCVDAGADALVRAVRTLFRPRSCQVIAYSPSQAFEFNSLTGASIKAQAERRLSNGFIIQYFSVAEGVREVVELVPVPEYKVPAPPAGPPPSVENEFAKDWLIEKTAGLMHGAKIKAKLFAGESDTQTIEVYDTETWGKTLVTGGLITCTERDEYAYHEMLAQVPLFVHHSPHRVLILGGGDLATAREVLKHSAVNECVSVERDSLLVDVCRQHFAWPARVMADERFRLVSDNPANYLATGEQQYDLILVENRAVVTPEGLAQIKDMLAAGGVVVVQAGCAVYGHSEQVALQQNLLNYFTKVHFYNYANLSYPGGLWSFAFANDTYHPLEDYDREKAQKTQLDLKYYNSEIHYGAFYLPTFMQRNLATGVPPRAAELGL